MRDIRICIAIDGPAGAGKSTVAKLVARRLGFNYIDTGAMYRAATLLALRKGYDLSNEEQILSLISTADIKLTFDPEVLTRVYLSREDVTAEIRSQEVSRHVSLVARLPGVRRQMVTGQRQMAAMGNVVMEGRDIGTTVLPEAPLKFFLTASPEERARRRQAELAAGKHSISLDDLVKEIMQRDLMDSTRETAPLRPAPDAEIIDCTGMTPEDVADYIINKVRSVG